jgi:hypothetical protein
MSKMTKRNTTPPRNNALLIVTAPNRTNKKQSEWQGKSKPHEQFEKPSYFSTRREVLAATHHLLNRPVEPGTMDAIGLWDPRTTDR